MSKYAEIDSSDFPIIKVVFTGEAASEDNFSTYLFELKQIYLSKLPIAILFDASNAVFPGIKYQKMQAQWLKDNEQLMKSFCQGTAYVIPNFLIRNVLNTIFTFQKQPVDYKVCRTYSEAVSWIKNKLRPFKN